MRIRMAGIDHNKASIQYRETFAFTKTGIEEALAKIKAVPGVEGCLLLSTCNRTELWLSGDAAPEPYGLLCRLKAQEENIYREYFMGREGLDAVDHLLNLVCGFDSRIFAEDQIISQVREALNCTRELGYADMVIEKIFQTALSAGKAVKTKVSVSYANPSSARAMMDILADRMPALKGVPCLVIGNGQMGRLAAESLKSAGASVSMTKRKQLHGNTPQDSVMPEGIRMVAYENRIEELADKAVVVSATLSPHYTLKAEDIAGRLEGRKCYLFDLAVPRDIDMRIGDLPEVELFDIDGLFGSEGDFEKSASLKSAENILREYREELQSWFEFRTYVPTIQGILELVSEDAKQRLVKGEGTEITDEEAKTVESAVKKATGKLIYGLRDTLPREMWNKCLHGLHEAAARDTLKH